MWTLIQYTGTGVCIRRRNLDAQRNIKDVCAQRKDQVKTRQEDAKARGLWDKPNLPTS